MPETIKTAVFPVAGLGTRFLPATKAMPKEMLTVVDKPVIQWVVEEAREAGIEHFIFVTGRNKSIIEDHFDRQYELEHTLREKGKLLELTLLESELPVAGQTSFTRQQRPLGLGHAIWCARKLVGDQPFAVLLPDMLVHAARSCLAQMMSAYARTGGNMVAVEEVPPEQTHRYGIVGVGQRSTDTFEVTSMVEKPAPGTEPSNYMIMGRYILQPEIFPILERQAAGAGDEIQLTDAMVTLLGKQTFHGFEFQGRTFDCGDKVGYLTANIAFALARDDIRERFRDKLDELLLRPAPRAAAAPVAAATNGQDAAPEPPDAPADSPAGEVPEETAQEPVPAVVAEEPEPEIVEDAAPEATPDETPSQEGPGEAEAPAADQPEPDPVEPAAAENVQPQDSQIAEPGEQAR